MIFQAHAQRAIFVGYDEKRRGYRVLEPGKRNFTVARSVIFNEKQIVKNIVAKSASKAASTIDTIQVDYKRKVSSKSQHSTGILENNSDILSEHDRSYFAQPKLIADGETYPKRPMTRYALSQKPIEIPKAQDDNSLSTKRGRPKGKYANLRRELSLAVANTTEPIYVNVVSDVCRNYNTTVV